MSSEDYVDGYEAGKKEMADLIFQELGKAAVKAKRELQTVDDVQRRNPRLAEIEHECGERILNFWRNTSYHLKLKLKQEIEK